MAGFEDTLRLTRETCIYCDSWNSLSPPRGPKEAPLLGKGGQEKLQEGVATLLSPSAPLWAHLQQQSLPGRLVQATRTTRPGLSPAEQSKRSPSHPTRGEPSRTLQRAEASQQDSRLFGSPDPLMEPFLHRPA